MEDVEGFKRRSSDAGVFAVPSPPGPQGSQHKSLPSVSGIPYSQREAPGKDQSRKVKKTKSSSKNSKNIKEKQFKFIEYKVRG